jgi:hypothetical protein
VRGTVTDTSGEVIKDAEVVLQAGPSTNILTLIDSTDVEGKFAIVGIPKQYASASLSVTADGHNSYSATVSLSGDTLTLTIELVPLPATAASMKSGAQEYFIRRSNGRTLILTQSAGCHVSVYTLSGRQIFAAQVLSDSQTIRLPHLLASQPFSLRLSRRGRTVYRNILLP